MNLLIRDFDIIIGFIICYCKFTNTIINKKKMLSLSLGILLITATFFIIDKNSLYLTILVLYALLLIFVCVMFKQRIRDSYFICLFSFAIDYVLFAISAIVVAGCTLFMSIRVAEAVNQVLNLVVHMIIIWFVLKNKRIIKGVKYLNKQIYSIPGSLIFIMILFVSDCLNKDSEEIYYFFAFILLLLLAILLFIYWRTSITRHYLERLSLRNIDMLNKELEEKNAYIEKLLEDKNRIEKLNHKNYKLVPAMQGAVMNYLNGVKSYMESSLDDPALAEMAVTSEGTFVKNKLSNFIEEGNKLIEELNKMNSEWTEYVNNDNLNGDSDVPSCGVPRVDYILSYMHERSLKEDFILKINVEQSLEKLTEKIISEEDLATLLADLIDNAIIATKYNNGKQILVRLGMMGKDYTIEVYDSGIPFDKEVLAKYGREQITTHADDSGSGIGMMQTYEILSKCGAGLFVDEYKQGEGVYTKRISVVFNRKHQYVLYTCRNDEDIAYLKKRSDLMVIKK